MTYVVRTTTRSAKVLTTEWSLEQESFQLVPKVVNGWCWYNVVSWYWYWYWYWDFFLCCSILIFLIPIHVSGTHKGSGKVSIHIVPQVNKLDCNGVVRHRQEPPLSLGHSPYPHTLTLDTGHAATMWHGCTTCFLAIWVCLLKLMHTLHCWWQWLHRKNHWILLMRC